MSDELKPCPIPWCDGDGRDISSPKGTWHNIECSLCGAEGPLERTEAAAIAAWNTRPAEQAIRNAAIEKCAAIAAEWFPPGSEPSSNRYGVVASIRALKDRP